MKKERVERGKLFLIPIFLIFIILVASAFVSAGFLDWFKKSITGRAVSQGTNMSISVSGKAPILIRVWNNSIGGSGIDPNVKNYSVIIFNVTIYDADGYNDINDSSVWVNVTMSGEKGERSNSTCKEVSSANNASSINYTCSVTMWYWDKIGKWSINVTANDLGNKTYYSNDSTTFYYNQLQGIEIGPEVLSWPSVSPGNINQTSDNDPTQINNTGNFNATGKINVTAINLYGTTTTTEYIDAANFSISTFTGGTVAECNSSSTTLENGTATTITGTLLNPGNLTLGLANESIYYCIQTVPADISSQVYSTNLTGSWTIKVTS